MNDKNKKIKHIFAKVLKGFGICLLILMIILLIVGKKKTNALSSYDSYNYKYIYLLTNKDISSNDSNYYIFDGTILGYFNGNEWVNGEPEVMRHIDIYAQVVLDSSDGLGISQANVNVGNIYLIKGNLITAQDRYNVYSVTTLTIYNRVLTSNMYNDGYSSGLDSNQTESWQQGYDTAITNLEQTYLTALNTATQTYNDTIASKDAEIASLREQINSGTTSWGSFQSLLATIFLFPIKFFKEGFNVELFGVNIGGLIIGIGLIGITIALLGVILGKRGN